VSFVVNPSYAPDNCIKDLKPPSPSLETIVKKPGKATCRSNSHGAMNAVSSHGASATPDLRRRNVALKFRERGARRRRPL
jgi:hypothetical protein